jgi:two-component system cell cycle response regulator
MFLRPTSLIKKLCTRKSVNQVDNIDAIYDLHLNLDEVENLHQLASRLFDWASRKLSLSGLLLIVDDGSSSSEKIEMGSEFEIHDESVFSFVSQVKATISIKVYLKASSDEEYIRLRDEYENFNELLFEMSEIIKKIVLKHKLVEASMRDSLTGLYNRTFLDEYIPKLFSLSSRNSQQIAFVLLAIDHFKAAIDEFNYEVGDKLHSRLASNLKSQLRGSDTVIRLDSNEFLVILPNIKSDEIAYRVAKKLVDSFAKGETEVGGGHILKKTISAGISIYPDTHSSLDELIRQSNIALVEAHNKGRGEIVIFDEEEANDVELF